MKEQNMVARAQASRHSGDLTEQASEAADALRGSLTTLREQATAQAADVTQRLRERGSEMLAEQKLRAAEELSHLGAAVRRAADKLHDTNSTALATYVDTAAQKLDGAAQFLEEQDLSALAEEVGRFARRNPAWVVGGLFVTGLAIGRFLKAGESNRAPRGRRSSRAERESR